jgi:hypothetical protein
LASDAHILESDSIGLRVALLGNRREMMDAQSHKRNLVEKIANTGHIGRSIRRNVAQF